MPIPNLFVVKSGCSLSSETRQILVILVVKRYARDRAYKRFFRLQAEGERETAIGLFHRSTELCTSWPRCRKNYTSRRTLNNQVTMVKVWYEPPPGGPRTHLNRGGYYVESARTPAFITRMSKARPITVIIPAIAAISAFCYLPLSK